MKAAALVVVLAACVCAKKEVSADEQAQKASEEEQREERRESAPRSLLDPGLLERFYEGRQTDGPDHANLLKALGIARLTEPEDSLIVASILDAMAEASPHGSDEKLKDEILALHVLLSRQKEAPSRSIFFYSASEQAFSDFAQAEIGFPTYVKCVNGIFDALGAGRSLDELSPVAREAVESAPGLLAWAHSFGGLGGFAPDHADGALPFDEETTAEAMKGLKVFRYPGTDEHKHEQVALIAGLARHVCAGEAACDAALRKELGPALDELIRFTKTDPLAEVEAQIRAGRQHDEL